jgi:stearoyl-CoA desaturase (delta-9 desaturase)
MDFQLFLKKYHIPTTLALIMLPLVSIICLPLYIYNYGIMWHEPFLFISGWIISGLGITFGYHRLFAHRSFKAHKIIQFLAMLSGSMALQNSILKWCSDHRTHHKKLDTEEDPYSIIKGFFHAHIGWVIENNNAKIKGVNDLKRNPVVMFQEKNYWVISITLSFIVPLIIGFIYGRPFGSLLWGGILRVTVVHHATFFINSLCHFIGKRPFEPKITARDSWWVAFLTFGEGFHNFHHKFHWDYRNGIRWYDFDPGKWIIKILSFFRLTSNIQKAEEHQILKARYNGLLEKIQLSHAQASNKINSLYSKQVHEIQEKASNVYSKWIDFELNFKDLKSRGFSDRFEKARMIHKRKMLKMEYSSLLNGLSIILLSIRNSNYI